MVLPLASLVAYGLYIPGASWISRSARSPFNTIITSSSVSAVGNALGMSKHRTFLRSQAAIPAERSTDSRCGVGDAASSFFHTFLYGAPLTQALVFILPSRFL